MLAAVTVGLLTWLKRPDVQRLCFFTLFLLSSWSCSLTNAFLLLVSSSSSDRTGIISLRMRRTVWKWWRRWRSCVTDWSSPGEVIFWGGRDHRAEWTLTPWSLCFQSAVPERSPGLRLQRRQQGSGGKTGRKKPQKQQHHDTHAPLRDVERLKWFIQVSVSYRLPDWRSTGGPGRPLLVDTATTLDCPRHKLETQTWTSFYVDPQSCTCLWLEGSTFFFLTILVVLQVQEVNAQLQREKEAEVQARQAARNAEQAIGGGAGGGKGWNEDDLQLLIKAVNLFPAGTNAR